MIGAVGLRDRMLSSISTLSLAITMIPVPRRTPATILPGGAKLGVSLAITRLLATITLPPPITGRLGRSNTRIPPVLRVATLCSTSALRLFSISIPATLASAIELRTVMLCDWPT